jgi:hypothetical protein
MDVMAKQIIATTKKTHANLQLDSAKSYLPCVISPHLLSVPRLLAGTSNLGRRDETHSSYPILTLRLLDGENGFSRGKQKLQSHSLC